MNEPTMKEIAAKLSKASEYISKLADYTKRESIKLAGRYDQVAEEYKALAAQVEAMGERRCGTCEYWHHIEAGDGECYHDKNIEGRIYDGDDFMKVDICGPDFGFIHHERKEV